MFDEHYDAWLESQRNCRTGEALRRLNEGHAHNEKLFLADVWYPAVGSFDDMHAEYEVRSYKNGCYYLDFALLRPPHRVAWEIDDFSSHAKNVTRRSHEYNCDRQNQLVLDGWTVFRISLDAVRERPKQVQQFVLQAMGKLYGFIVPDKPTLTLKQREILRIAFRLQRPFAPAEICQALSIKHQHARALLHELASRQLLAPASGTARIRNYVIGPRFKPWYLD